MKNSHQKQYIPLANGAGYILCSCGWKSEVQDDGNMFQDKPYSAEAEFKNHLPANVPSRYIAE